VALRLHRAGIARVRPLGGGLAGWRARGYPVAALPVAAVSA
jgi:3-mercaptopyruvate sulfurtransferase SseA